MRLSLLLCAVLAAVSHLSAGEASRQSRYESLVKTDQPVAYWRFDQSRADGARSAPATLLVGDVSLQSPGPRPPRFDDFAAGNVAAAFDGAGDYVKVRDPGQRSVLDFDKGDSITLEAWVSLRRIERGQQLYIIGKGRTNRRGVARENQNYALRVRDTDGGGARISFLFRDADNRPAGHKEFADDWHRWTSHAAFFPASGWHHIAVTYTFGKGDSLRAYLDGRPVDGVWDMGGKTDQPPVVDDDELWIGSSLGGHGNTTFDGLIDEVAIYRRALSPERIKLRFRAEPIKVAPLKEPADGEVVAEIVEGVPDSDSWNFPPRPAGELFVQDTFAFTGVPKKYSSRALIVDRTPVFLVRASGDVKLPAGEHRLLLRSKGAARLFIDGKLILQTGFPPRHSSGHESVPAAPKALHPDLRALPIGHREKAATVKLDGRTHRYTLECLVGGRARRPEVGELSLSVSTAGGPFRLVGAAGSDTPHDDEHWRRLTASSRERMEKLNAQRRRIAGAEEAKYWARRHQLARQAAAEKPDAPVPDVRSQLDVHNDVDRFINHRLQAAGVEPSPLADDLAFLRRVYLDTVGVIPTPKEIREFLDESPSLRRRRVVDHLLADRRWADHWVPYWQDVLAENPGILKPKLNNTGPFRWWIYESFLDNKPLDRFVTELVMMEGSTYGGGPAGFALATQNDAPMAAKAHVLAKAFLGVELKCARCHDAPYHPYKQRDTFSLAAMLTRSPVRVPATSSIDLEELARRPLVQVTLKPGTQVPPQWPFASLANGKLPQGLLRNASDSRRRLAGLLTSGQNERFAQVMVNRLWKRYLGRGFVEPVDDWSAAKPSHPQLLAWLGRQFVSSGYDLNHVARLVLNSHTYQRSLATPQADESTAAKARALFAAPTRRRMTAEQIVDSLFSAVGKQFDSEPLTLDPDNRRPAKDFLNLGVPRRAWEFAPLSNERDRPALSLPVAQSVIDVLATFGWRASRQHPTSVRENEPTVLQPLVLANGTVGGRITRLSDNSAVTELCLTDQSLDQLIEQTSLRVLTRRPDESEREIIRELLRPGYTDRRRPGEPIRRRATRSGVSWSNHLSPEATRLKLQLEQAARQGDPPTARLTKAWRERMEDTLWAMVNSPEFLFVP